MAERGIYNCYKMMLQSMKNQNDEKIVRYIANAIGAAYLQKQITLEQKLQLFKHLSNLQVMRNRL